MFLRLLPNVPRLFLGAGLKKLSAWSHGRGVTLSGEKGMISGFMGIVMAEVRGSIDGRVVSQVLKEEISRQISPNAPGDKI